jgi:predicted dehydrogenase
MQAADLPALAPHGPDPVTRPLRFGLVGTGYWAQIAHAPALASTEGIEFAAVWGRNADAAAQLAATYNATAHGDLEAFLASIDAVAFAVPPNVQAPIAIRAARAGKHLLLEKPIAIAPADADTLVAAVDSARVASVVFFTARFQANVRAWLADAQAAGGWAGGCAVWLGSALRQGSPFNTPWRREKGALWDLGPHVISLLWASLGAVGSVTAEAGQGDVTHLVLHHDTGLTSSVTVTLDQPQNAEFSELFLWGEPGLSVCPTETENSVTPLRTALTELAANARSGHVSHPCDVRLGRDIGHILADAQRQIG